MADKKITDLTPSSGLVAADLFEVVDDPAGTPASQKATVAQVAAAVKAINTSGVFVFTGDGSTVTFTGAAVSGGTLAYTVGRLDAYVDGTFVDQITATNGTSVVFATAPYTGARVVLKAR